MLKIGGIVGYFARSINWAEIDALDTISVSLTESSYPLLSKGLLEYLPD